MINIDLKKDFALVLYIKNKIALAKEFACAIRYANSCINSIICLAVPVTVLLSMLYTTNVVTEVMENIRNTIVILDDNFMITLLVSCITS